MLGNSKGHRETNEVFLGQADLFTGRGGDIPQEGVIPDIAVAPSFDPFDSLAGRRRCLHPLPNVLEQRYF